MSDLKELKETMFKTAANVLVKDAGLTSMAYRAATKSPRAAGAIVGAAGGAAVGGAVSEDGASGALAGAALGAGLGAAAGPMALKGIQNRTSTAVTRNAAKKAPSVSGDVSAAATKAPVAPAPAREAQAIRVDPHAPVVEPKPATAGAFPADPNAPNVAAQPATPAAKKFERSSGSQQSMGGSTGGTPWPKGTNSPLVKADKPNMLSKAFTGAHNLVKKFVPGMN